MRILLSLLVVFSSWALAAPDEEALGKAQNYPVCKIQELPARPECVVGTLSHMDEVLPARKVAAGKAREFKRADKAAALEADDYMAKNRSSGLLVLKGDTILAERYNYDRKPTDRFQSYSMAKTVVAMLIGIALQEQKIKSIDDLAEQYVPQLKGEEYGKTSLKNLLTMSSGIAFSERYDGKDDVTILGRKTLLGEGPGGVESVKGFNNRAAPAGTRFSYASSETEVLSLVLRAATGKNLSEYLSEKIWIPMGAEADAMWLIDGGGNELGFMGLNATLRDWGRLGMLLANYGALDGKQIIPAAWVRDATRVHAPHLEVGTATQYNGYGYQTWLIRKDSPMFALMGVRGQVVFVDPVSKFVVVNTSVWPNAADNTGRRPQFEFFFRNLAKMASE